MEAETSIAEALRILALLCDERAKAERDASVRLSDMARELHLIATSYNGNSFIASSYTINNKQLAVKQKNDRLPSRHLQECLDAYNDILGNMPNFVFHHKLSDKVRRALTARFRDKSISTSEQMQDICRHVRDKVAFVHRPSEKWPGKKDIFFLIRSEHRVAEIRDGKFDSASDNLSERGERR